MSNRNLDVLFVKPNNSSKIYQGLSTNYSAIETPTWSLLLAESCRSIGYDVAIMDTCAENLSDEESIERIKSLNYSINIAFGRLDQLLRAIETKLNTKEDEHKSTS